MKKNNKILLLIIPFILSPYTVYAACTQEELNHFKEIEDQYKVTYEFNEERKDYTLNLHSEKYKQYLLMYDNMDNAKFNEDGEALDIILEHMEAGKYKFFILGTSDSCQETLKTIELNLSKYNDLYKDPLCEGIEEFVLCQPTYDKEITYEEFVSRVNTYKNTKNNNSQKKDNDNNKNINNAINYVEDNLFTIITIAIFTAVVIVTIILTAKSIMKRRRLE